MFQKPCEEALKASFWCHKTTYGVALLAGASLLPCVQLNRCFPFPRNAMSAKLTCCAAGAWQLRDGPDLSWTQGNNWRAVIELPSGTVYEYKYVLLDSQSGQALTWQRGNNSVLAVKAGEDSIEVSWSHWQVPSMHSLRPQSVRLL